MQKNNLNQQPSSYKRRQCLTYLPNSFFKEFQSSQNQIIANYQQKSQLLLLESLTILIQNIREGNNSKTNQEKIMPQLNQNLMSKIKHKPNVTFKKQLTQLGLNYEATNPEKQLKQFICMQKTGKKPIQSNKSTKNPQFCVNQKEKSNHYNKLSHQNLILSMDRLSVDDEQQFFKDAQIQNIEQNNQNPAIQTQPQPEQVNQQNIKRKSISQLLLESDLKSKSYKKEPPLEIDQQSEYQITDHSSNQSSNDDDYQERYVYEKQYNTNLFGDMFIGNKIFSGDSFGSTTNASQNSLQHPPTKFNMKPILDSPKKSITKRKKLYINKKKVPQWASDLAQVEQAYKFQQQKSLQQTFLNKFGKCIVQQLQTNTICNRNDVYNRASTAKWQKRKGGYVI